MVILGLSPAGQVIVLQALATYTAIASAYLFARPILRSQTLQTHRDVMSSVVPKTKPNTPVADLFQQASTLLNDAALEDSPNVKRDNTFGILCLLVSLLLFSVALTIQLSTDPAFREPPATNSHQ